MEASCTDVPDCLRRSHLIATDVHVLNFSHELIYRHGCHIIFKIICLTGRDICSVANCESSAANRINTHVFLNPYQFPLLNFLQHLWQRKPEPHAACQVGRSTQGSVEEKRLTLAFTFQAHAWQLHSLLPQRNLLVTFNCECNHWQSVLHTENTV